MKFEVSIKQSLFNILVRKDDFFGAYKDYDGIITFLNKIWPLRDLPSEDERFDNAYDDVWQHMVNNVDWTLDYLFLDRFQLIKDSDEKVFVKFIECVVSPDVRQSSENILSYVLLINQVLEETPYRLMLADYFEEMPVYKLKRKDQFSDLPLHIEVNEIPFYVDSSSKHMKRPFFCLSSNRWDDYHNKTSFELSYYSQTDHFYIGPIKIMKRNVQVTIEQIDKKFISLSHEYCSMGQEDSFYKELQGHLGSKFQSVLLALRDVSFFPKIREEFEDEETFINSLIRYNEVEKLMRTIRFEMNGIDVATGFKFHYSFTPPYAENPISLNFDFKYGSEVDHRVYALIGKNGSGKTKILSTLAKDLSDNKSLKFKPRKPIYAKVFSVSYSFFDRFEIPESDASFNYVYCGLKKKDNTWLSNDDLKVRFFASAEKVAKRKLSESWRDTLLHLIPKAIIQELFLRKTDGYKNPYTFNSKDFATIQLKLSSGQSILLYIVTEILAQIRFNSLILYDEPETHLHPNAITALMNTLFGLVKEFDSFCILATHSPLIIQEIQARDIYVLDRIDDTARVRTLERESFAENLSVITEEIFGNRDVSKHHLTKLEELVKSNKSYEEIVKLLENEIPLNLNTRLYIKSLIADRNEES